MNLVAGHDETVIAWLAQAFGVHVLQYPRATLGIVDRNGVLRGAFVITWRNDTSAELHGFGAISANTVRQMFKAVFGQYGVHRLEVRTPRKNKKIKKAAIKYGFRFESVARDDYGPGNDGFVYAMTAPECRFLREVQNGQHVQVA